MLVGAFEGSPVGLCVEGVTLGRGDGTTLGFKVLGCTLGLQVGPVVSTLVGFIVGLIVGRGEGRNE
jgi:tetrahydromethanopterin S-methyltransferase subunit C